MEKTGENRHVKNDHISEEKIREIIRGFCMDLTAQNVSDLTNLSRNTINKYFSKIRKRIILLAQEEAPFSGEIELDESYFGAKRIRGKRGRGAAWEDTRLWRLKTGCQRVC